MESVHHWINGSASEPDGGEFFDVLNPLDDSLYARAAKGSAADVARAIDAADEAFGKFRNSLPSEREAWLITAAELLEKQADEFIEILIDEIGSPITKARREVATSIGVLRAAAGTTRRLAGKTMPTDVPGRLSISLREPLGVVAGITPFNVPLIKGIKHSAMPLATGNTVVMLPSEEAPTIGVRIAQLYCDAGFPDGVCNVVCGSGYEIGDFLTTDPRIRMVGFTGSTRVGRHIGELCGKHGKRYTLEMGGKNPLIICRDADIDQAVAASIVGSFLFQGQICMSSSRIFVQQERMNEFIDKFITAARKLGTGDLHDPSTMIGPIINDRQRPRIREHIDDAVKKGACVRIGGQWQENRCQPTILTDVSADATMAEEETFGPVTAVYSFDSEDEAIKRANDTRYGLTASVYTSDLDAAMHFARNLHAGMVHINGNTVQEEAHVPFGGVGDSGFGREGTQVSIDELTEWKWITINGSLGPRT